MHALFIVVHLRVQRKGFLAFTGAGNLEVANLAFDAACVPVQFGARDYNALKIAVGLNVEGLRSFTLKECDFENIYGYGVRCVGIHTVLVSRCTFLNVGGHWYENNDFDAFGDGVYIAKTPEGGDAVVEYCDIRSYPVPQNPVSRIGITFEYCDKSHTALGTLTSCIGVAA